MAGEKSVTGLVRETERGPPRPAFSMMGLDCGMGRGVEEKENLLP